MTRRVSRPAENEGVTKLMMAVSECNMGQVKHLIGGGGDLQARDKHGRNVLYHAFAGSEMTEGGDPSLSYPCFLSLAHFVLGSGLLSVTLYVFFSLC